MKGQHINLPRGVVMHRRGGYVRLSDRGRYTHGVVVDECAPVTQEMWNTLLRNPREGWERLEVEMSAELLRAYLSRNPDSFVRNGYLVSVSYQ